MEPLNPKEFYQLLHHPEEKNESTFFNNPDNRIWPSCGEIENIFIANLSGLNQ